jgi:beta-glucosidase
MCLASLGTCLCIAQGTPKYLDPTVSIEQRINDLLPRMTVGEKVSQISDDWGSAGILRLKVPSLLKTEGLHGQSYSTGATIFPQAIGMAATFDPALINKIGRQTALESKAAHIRESWSPVLDVARDVRWGRLEETYGESPYLVSRMGVAWIEGFQGEGMIAVPKHFAGHGQPMGGRDSQDIGLSDRVMREIHLPSFRAAVEAAQAGGLMAAYGVPDNASATLLKKILRQEWGFDGFVISDCSALENLVEKQGIVHTVPEAAALGIRAGVSMNCGTTYHNWAGKALEQGLITESELDEAVRPILRAKFRLGLFEHPEPDKMVWEKLPEYDTSEARTLAREVAVEGSVLLKNDKGLLPLSKDIGTIAIIGPIADSAQTGDYSPKTAPDQMVTVLEGVRSHVKPGTKVLFAPGLDSPLSTDTSKFAQAIVAAKEADVAIVIVGDSSHPGGPEGTTGENRDGATLEFPGVQRDLVRAIQATGTPVVLVIVNGKPVTLAWEAAHIPAILITWYPGEEGGNATADLLFGDRSPSGRLPITWPRSPGQLPLNYDYLPSGRRYDYYDMSFTPQWTFGYGLSYTHFKYSNLRILPRDGDPGFVTISADVQNSGGRDGDEVSQLYVTEMISSVVTPVVELKGVQRVSLKAGETKEVTFQLTPYQLSLLDANMSRRVEPGTFRIHVGGTCPTVPDGVIDRHKEKIGFYHSEEGISGEFTELKDYAALFVYTLESPERVKSGQSFAANVTVRNEGNLSDVTETRLFAGSELGSWSFELKPGEKQSHTFHLAMYKPGNLSLVAGTQIVSSEIAVDKTSARLVLNGLRMQINQDSTPQGTADSQDAESEHYDAPISGKVDGSSSPSSAGRIPGPVRIVLPSNDH